MDCLVGSFVYLGWLFGGLVGGLVCVKSKCERAGLLVYTTVTIFAVTFSFCCCWFLGSLVRFLAGLVGWVLIGRLSGASFCRCLFGLAILVGWC